MKSKRKISSKKGPGRRTDKKVVKPKLLKAIKLMGSMAELGRAIPTSQSYLSHMLYNDHIGVSERVAERIEKLTKGAVKAKELRPKKGKNRKSAKDKK